jgi:pyrroline-5-carboxylate reductase
MGAPSSALPASLLLVGAGRMGGAMLRGWLDLGLPAKAIHVIDPSLPPDMAALCADRGVVLGPFEAPPGVAVLAIKPQMLDVAAPGLAPMLGPQTLILSILAGKTLADLQARFPHVPAAVRAMPNLPAAIGQGVIGAVASSAVTAAARETAHALLAAVGGVEWLDDEGLIDAVTAVSGSGPAYVFLLAECLAEAGTAAGLPPVIAARLARKTVEGAGALLATDGGKAASDLRVAVTSPGGTTAAALDVLMAEDGLQRLLTKAVAAAKARAAALSG